MYDIAYTFVMTTPHTYVIAYMYVCMYYVSFRHTIWAQQISLVRFAQYQYKTKQNRFSNSAILEFYYYFNFY